MIRPLQLFYSESLRKPCIKFDFKNPPEDPIELAHDLAQSMIQYNGIGLAANQVGLPYRVFALKTQPIIVAFNPIIVDTSTEIVMMEEACLSWPGIVFNIKRPKSIRMRYTEPNGNVETKKFTGITARTVQHEIDHLDGHIFAPNLSRAAIELAIKKAKKRGANYTISDFLKGEPVQ
jgi:peptide deformylase